ncbi:MAG: S9 family peptidase, partial [Candidatus Zixiibacteriota bacterium]
MRHITAFVLSGVCLTLTGCQTMTSVATSAKAPVAKIEPAELEKHGHVRVDNSSWLKDRDNPEVIEYLKEENEYTGQMMAHTKKFEEALFEEIKGRIKQDDASAPYRENGYWYYTRYEEGGEYPLYCRKQGTLEAAEEIMLNVNELAKGHEFYAVAAVRVTENRNIVSYAVDTTGRRIYSVRFKNLETGENLDDALDSVTANSAWANDSKTILYARQDPVTLRYYRIYRHTLGADQSEDKLIYEETDETFSCYVWKTKSKKYLMIGSYQTLSSEIRYADANKPKGKFKVFLPRERDHEYEIDHFKDKFYIYTNYKAKNFRLMETKVGRNAKDNWRDVIPHREDVLLESTELFNDFLVVKERKNGLTQIQVRPWDGSGAHYLDFGEPTYDAGFGKNKDFDTKLLRYHYTSMTTPGTDYDYDMTTREKTLIKREEVLGGFDPEDYVTERLFATADDGAQVPISICYKKSLQKDGANPVLLYGYGSYGYSMDANFRSYRYSLIDRGFIYAIAHVRGGQELGRQWYEDGKLLNKKNTFTDFIACAKHLVSEKYTSPEKLYAYGGSAGGLLV